MLHCGCVVVLVSVVSFWEISIKHRIGKLDDQGSIIMREVKDSGFDVIQLGASHLALLEELEPKPGHKDPFDHLILVQAMAEDAILVTSDPFLRSYGVRCL